VQIWRSGLRVQLSTIFAFFSTFTTEHPFVNKRFSVNVYLPVWSQVDEADDAKKSRLICEDI
jgi:hypothetical protein